ncbi:hypothetical protein [Cytobacillus gottheilii]|uniref:hypothetical protein n=1 Tax=Cytobacillus gottheilii TaxID=859144 RepID=UPI001C579633|nr:hypothetical protein [Cytobacillus gottheilii]
MLVTAIEVTIAWIWWKKGMEIVRFNSLTAFLMFSTFGVFLVFPLLRISNGMFFWVVLAFYLFIAFYSLYKRELVFQAFHKPKGSKLYISIIVILFIFLIVGALSFRYGQEMVILAMMNDHQGAFFISVFLYFIGLFVTFISTSLLKKPSEIKRK